VAANLAAAAVAADPQLLGSMVEAVIASQCPAAWSTGTCERAQATGPLSPFVCAHLINLYSKLDLPSAATAALAADPSPTVVSYTAFISGQQ
jgi:hypothetical protein